MDLKTFFVTFGMIFLAELGDKTQLAVLSLTADTRKPVSIFLGAMIAFAAITLLAVIFGEALAKFVPEFYLKKAVALIFIGVGIIIFLGKY